MTVRRRSVPSSATRSKSIRKYIPGSTIISNGQNNQLMYWPITRLRPGDRTARDKKYDRPSVGQQIASSIAGNRMWTTCFYGRNRKPVANIRNFDTLCPYPWRGTNRQFYPKQLTGNTQPYWDPANGGIMQLRNVITGSLPAGRRGERPMDLPIRRLLLHPVVDRNDDWCIFCFSCTEALHIIRPRQRPIHVQDDRYSVFFFSFLLQVQPPHRILPTNHQYFCLLISNNLMVTASRLHINH